MEPWVVFLLALYEATEADTGVLVETAVVRTAAGITAENVLGLLTYLEGRGFIQQPAIGAIRITDDGVAWIARFTDDP